jgi:PAS domain S-box-containing protein
MKSPGISPFKMTERYWRGIILAASFAVIIFTLWCLTHGITTIFMHLYYFPIVLLAYHYRWKGVGLATLLALAYLGLVIIVDISQIEVILGALYRVLVFVGIAAVIAYLSDRLVQSQRIEQESTDLKKQYLSLAPAIILVLDRQGTITYLNEKGCAILDCPLEGVMGKSWVDTFIKADERDAVRALFTRIIEGNIDLHGVVEGTVIPLTGRLRYISWNNTLLKDVDGTISGVLSYGEDITEEKAAQDTLIKMQQFQEGVIANANVWISVLAPDGTILIWNDAAEKISGYKKTEVVGTKNIWKLLYPSSEYRKNVTRDITRIIRRDTYLENFETEIRCADGTAKKIVWNTRALRDKAGTIISYIAIGRDVTEQRSAEFRAGESSRFLATMIETLPVPIFFKDTNGKYLGCNPPFEEYIGIKRDQLFGKTVYDISPKDLADRYNAADQQMFSHPVPQHYETQVQYADGSRHDVIFYKAPFFNSDGTLGGLIGTFLDITDRKRSETALHESEEKIHLVLNSAAEAIYGLDMKGNCTFCNTACVRLLGYHHQDELLGKNMHQQIHAKHADGSPFPVEECRIFQAFKKGEGTHVDDEVLWHADGTSFPAEYWSYPQRLNGEVVGAVVTFLDITDRKRAENALQDSEKKYRTLFENMLEGFAYCRMIYDEQGQSVDWVYLSVNRSFERLTGLKNIEGKRVLEAIPDIRELTPELFEMYGRVASTGTPETFEINFKPLKTWLSVSAFCPEKGYFVAVFEDISERKTSQERIEALLQVQEEQLRVINTSPAVAFLWKAEENWPVEAVSENISQFGYTREDFTSGKISFSSIIHPDDLNRVGEEVAYNSSHYVDDYIQEYRIFTKNHDLFWITDYTHIRRDSAGKITHYEGIVLDITDRKRAEEEIRLANVILKTQQETSPDGILIVDNSGKILSFNRRFTEIWGIPQEIIDTRLDERVLSFVLEKLVLPHEFLARVRYLYEHWEDKSREEIQLHDGKVFERYSAPMLDEDNRYFGRVWYFHDISERKEAEKAISESRQLFKDIISFLPDPTFVIDKDGNVIAWNRALEQLSGVASGDIIGKGNYEYSLWLYGKRRPILIDLVLHPDMDSARMHYTDILWEGKTVTAQSVITRNRGGSEQTIPLSLIASPLQDADGRITGAIESIRDISRLKEAEAELAHINTNLEKMVRERTEALTESERKYHTLFDKTKDAYLIIENNKFVDCNAAALQMLGYKTKEELFQIHPSIISPPIQPDGRSSFEKAEEMMMVTLREGSNRFEWVHRRANGEDFWVEVSLTAIPIHDHKIIHTAWRDINDRKKAEAEILKQLEEKVILLREVHHRVKNNLQIIISLVNLQMRQTEDPEVKQIMSETQNRVRAMSLVHEKLYRSESLSHIDFADYTRFLATQLFSFYGMDSQRVRLDFTMGRIMLDINTAVPLGLLMNELISNALKHAFPNGRNGVISISGGEEGDLITLVVRDNGIGIPAGLDWKNTTSLGMRLVTSLIDQVDGTIVLDRNLGTTFTLTIRRKSAIGGAE